MSFVHFLKLNCVLLHLLSFKISLCILESSLSLDVGFTSIFSQYVHACQTTQSCTNLCHTVDCSPPGSSVHGILRAGLLEWVAISFSRGSSQPRDRTYVSHFLCQQAGSLPPASPGKHPSSVVFVFILLTGPFRESEFLIS